MERRVKTVKITHQHGAILHRSVTPSNNILCLYHIMLVIHIRFF